MKLPFTIYDLRSAIWKKSGEVVRPPATDGAHGVTRPTALNRQSSIANHKSQSGVALVITLILLSVTLVMALAFLAISGRERGSVTTQTDTATTRLAADAGLAAAEAQIAANILSTTNPYSFGLLVSTNYLPATNSNVLQDLTNMQYSPRVPVWLTNLLTGAMENRFYLDLNRNGKDDPNGLVPVINNAGFTTGNTNFEVGDPEWIGVLERPDLPYGPNNLFIARYAFIALPVGNSLDLNAIHNQALTPARTTKSPIALTSDYYARNQGVGSWEINLAAFLTDLNSDEWDPSTDPYNYLQPNFANTGRGFEDAFTLLTNRYAGTYTTLPSVNTLFGPPGVGTTVFANDNIDGYSDGPLMTGTQLPADNDNAFAHWLGADNTNHYFTPEELFNTNETATFGVHLLNAGTNTYGGSTVSTYDRYTFYRMLSQLGTDTAPESGKMNLNYDNLVQANFFSGAVSETNFFNWQPLAFFTNAADRMLKAYTAQWFQAGPSNYLATYYGITNNYYYFNGFSNVYYDPTGLGLTNIPYYGITNSIPNFGITISPGVTNLIPVLVGNQFVYTPAVQRVLQLAANIYDATTQNYYPSVFRPLFSRNANNLGVAGMGTNLFVIGYEQVTQIINAPDQPVDASFLANMNSIIPVINWDTNVYGVPWIIGAKKGFPNFNAFTMQNTFGLTRKLQVTRDYADRYVYTTPPANYTVSQQLTLGITNAFWAECWNSYFSDYTNTPVGILVKGVNTTVLTNAQGLYYPVTFSFTNSYATNDWPGSHWLGYGLNYTPDSASFIWHPLNQGEFVVPGWIYTFNPAANLAFQLPSPAYFVTNTASPSMAPSSPHWGLLVTNRLQVVMYATDAGGTNHIIDYVQLIGPDSSHDVTTDIQKQYDVDLNHAPITEGGTGFNGYNDQWDANVIGGNPSGIPDGIANQISVSQANNPNPITPHYPIIFSPYWANQSSNSVIDQINVFRAFYGYGTLSGGTSSQAQRDAIANAKTSLGQQAPYTPTATIAYETDWKVNDPLVHYLASDLTDFNQSTAAVPAQNITPPPFGLVTDRYKPWGGNPQYPTDLNPYNRAIKDPGIQASDFWDFPTNKFPTAGWLGRVHRGTPWQTVYLKSSDLPATTVPVVIGTNSINLPTWAYLNGNANTYDATNTAPVQDRALFDLFTTAFNDNATRGTLSVNQSADQYDPVANPAAGLAAWSALFSGIVVPNPTNAANYAVINPAGPNAPALNPPLWQIATNINGTRSTFTNVDGLVGVFEHKGDILSTPQLTEQSPFLTGLNATNQISDAMYEWLPQQVMSLVRVGTPRYVIYSYGQALKPAPNGIYLGAGPFFGVVTNYQVMSEMATRAVVRLNTVRTNANGVIMVTPPRAVIESFNILPPD